MSPFPVQTQVSMCILFVNTLYHRQQYFGIITMKTMFKATVSKCVGNLTGTMESMSLAQGLYKVVHFEPMNHGLFLFGSVYREYFLGRL